MKKNLYFIVLLALCCVFFLKVGILPVFASTRVAVSCTNGDTGACNWSFTGLTPSTSFYMAFIFPSFTDDHAVSSDDSGVVVYNWGSLPPPYTTSALGDFYFYIFSTSSDRNNCISNTTTCMSTSLQYAEIHHNASSPYWSSDPLAPTITITAPDNASTITDLSTHLVVNWAMIDHTEWTDLQIYFQSLQISENSLVYHETLTADSGSVSIPLSYFQIPTNGQWKFYELVENATSIDFDITNPVYGLTFNVSGLETPYTFTDFPTWYSSNVSSYGSPSDWASAMLGYLQPIFEKIGEFTNRISDYLNVSDAYDKGFTIGGVFPIAMAYISKIDIFFGGFPIATFFKWAVIAMLGIFAVKIILKLLAFIPFVGGGG